MKKIIFTMGLPASGKSTTAKRLYPSLQMVDPDQIKETHPSYDPKNPELLHDWSIEEATKKMYSLLSGEESFLVDGTGTNIEKFLNWFQLAKSVGFEIEVLYVHTSLQTSIERNAKRNRVVPVEVIIEKSKTIEQAYSFYQTLVPCTKITNE